MTTPATRLITLILLLQRQPNQKAAKLAKELGVSIRTLHRYFGMLEEMGIPIYSERGPHGGFSLVRGYKLPPMIFTPEEAVVIYLGASLVAECGSVAGSAHLAPAHEGGVRSIILERLFYVKLSVLGGPLAHRQMSQKKQGQYP